MLRGAIMGLTTVLLIACSGQANADWYCPIADVNTCKTMRARADDAAVAAFTAMTAERRCPDILANRAAINEVLIQNGVNPNDFGSVGEAVERKFVAAGDQACALAMDLYGPLGRAIVLGEHFRQVQNLVSPRPRQNFLRE